MSDGIKVGGAGIDAMVQDMKKGLADIESRLTTMEGDLKPYVTDWEGTTQEAYRHAKQEWDKQIEECRALLEDVRLAVVQSKEDYLAGELRNTNMWG
ncbi:WXG100 family type VII secretion target [Phycicoccus sp. BSK3Z-2]|uniref:ESAT-6-like protein n=1 Tax=Phycicoccus avicenniae TaxID=2828860 RepID=A0A941D834_9MICO|nr:WXG100 family type VII secretion target [Phycicoccus avicenniae]MBR7742833.1 WXG100 family type VII secretion target [Phycicoccus avicenniae]